MLDLLKSFEKRLTWCLLSMSKPNSISIGCSSRMENEVVKKLFSILICAFEKNEKYIY